MTETITNGVDLDRGHTHGMFRHTAIIDDDHGAFDRGLPDGPRT